MTTAALAQGVTYAIGLKLPTFFRGPLAGLEELTAATGSAALPPSTQLGAMLQDAGWNDVTVYRTGRAPIVEPQQQQDYVAIGTHVGPAETVDLDTYQGVIVWIQAVTDASRVPVAPGGAGAPRGETPKWAWALGGAAVVGLVALVVYAAD